MREEAFVCIFCGHAGHLDEFCFRCKRIEKRRFEYARNSYHAEFFDFPLRSYSHASPRTSSRALLISPMDLTIVHMVLVHERIALCLDTLITAHVLIVVIVSFVGTVFLLEGLTPALSPDTWMVHTFPVVILVPLVQRGGAKDCEDVTSRNSHFVM
jgi:hypothetical protein